MIAEKEVMFTDKDIRQIESHGLTQDKVIDQIECIKSGMEYSNLVEAATINKGILKFDKQGMQQYVDLYNSKLNVLKVVKFVPASGAATRMFKFIYQFLKDYHEDEERLGHYLKTHKNFWVFVNGLEKLPFFENVVSRISNYSELAVEEKYIAFVKVMLADDGLNCSACPKGLLPFHKYNDEVLTAFHEHLLESTLYASSNNISNLHFTISEGHTKKFQKELENVQQKVQDKTGTKFNVSFSYQSKSTDTIAIKSNNELYRTPEGNLLFRPAGHGALLENLNRLDADLIFIKNIDNIVVLEQNKKQSEYKKLLAGVLLDAQEKAFQYLNELDKETVSERKLLEIAMFLTHRMNLRLDAEFDDFSFNEKVSYLYKKLNRPIRVCGMVKNEGEPGGGPFWVKDSEGHVSLQIIEFAQINVEDKSQKAIVKHATHFNPTDLVCGTKDYKGNKFNLHDFVDPKAAFITIKSQNGTDIKALELPGLWNGSMADWNSIFVEVPLSTFNPVKTVNDLLKPAHQVV
ncbi:DUF4301 family protein [Aestuariibaculum lutulentum]|uniref:DUF4301 family protein n=1 Tax=Aestuariibaculum lutulentum TaxID=2920935 RepID=A0ABS9RFX0_9FLAO|nr:DUF4301 family protein [Aestuariibaculum lutulentum]MCH4551844.1 DUF4301 family protein [Aestuariibaculum lutulentum]